MRERQELSSPDPTDNFEAKLVALYEAAGRPKADATRRFCRKLDMPVPTASKLTNWRKGTNVPADDESMLAVVRHWRGLARELNPDFKAEPAAEWKRLRKEAAEFKANKR